MPSSRAYPGLDRSPKENWVDKAGGLPSYIERIAKHLHYEKGMTISRAIATAVNAVKRMCATGDLNYKGKQNVNAKSRAQACAAVASWERKKASTRVKMTDVRGRKLTDGEFISILLATPQPKTKSTLRAPGASGSNRPFDETKYVRNPLTGQFGEKFTESEFLVARRTVFSAVTNLAAGATLNLPGSTGWIKRSADGSGYLIQGGAGVRLAVRSVDEAVQAAAALLAGKLAELGGKKRL
ncbi:MAG: hypothetical protein PHQ41_02300 [Candidatus Cloacimonetes bacterium]|nr:hypothetical protein [Candidatus Cloacimonadota bacterium]